MSSPWLSLPLADYEGHMSAPNVGQADLLAGVLADALKEFRPSSVAVIGCAGGNGFDRIDSLEVARVVGVDINPAFLEIASSRYSGRFKQFDLHCSDIAGARLEVEPVELIYAALVFEYVNVASALQNLFSACREGGHLVSLLQMPSSTVSTVTPTAFTSLKALGEVLKCVDPHGFEEMARNAGFELRRATRVTSVAGKEFVLHVFQHRKPVESKDRPSKQDLDAHSFPVFESMLSSTLRAMRIAN